MADLNNLLGELDDRDEPYLSDGPGGADELSGDDGGGYAGDSDGGRRAELPAALAEAERIKATAALRRDEDGPGYGDGDAAGPGAGTRPGDGTDEGADAEYERLKSLWSQEVMCPELLPNDPDTVALHAELLQGQEDTIEELKERAAAGLGIGGGADEPMLASLAASIYKMEADRVRFLLADLTRTRLAKIENHALYNRELVDRMSDEEVRCVPCDCCHSVSFAAVVLWSCYVFASNVFCVVPRINSHLTASVSFADKLP